MTNVNDAIGHERAQREERNAKKQVCAISGKDVPKRKLMVVASLRPSLVDRIRDDYPDLSDDAFVSITEIERYRTLYVEDMLLLERGELTEIDRQVAQSMADHETVVENIEEDFEDSRTLGERVSDTMASFGGSWSFLLTFFAFIGMWMMANLIMARSGAAFDEYPFILLNLVLSTIAAVQAPIIMMSQKRQAEKDRLRSLNDYKVNLKAELEVRHVQEKLDYLLTKQWQRLAEMQQMQMDLMQENLITMRSTQRKAPAKKKRSKPKAKPAKVAAQEGTVVEAVVKEPKA